MPKLLLSLDANGGHWSKTIRKKSIQPVGCGTPLSALGSLSAKTAFGSKHTPLKDRVPVFCKAQNTDVVYIRLNK